MPLTNADYIRMCICYKVEGNFMTKAERKKIRKEHHELLDHWEKWEREYDFIRGRDDE